MDAKDLFLNMNYFDDKHNLLNVIQTEQINTIFEKKQEIKLNWK